MRLSILIPTLNEEETIGDAIRRASDLGEQIGLVEIIVADGGSEDATVEIATRLGVRVVSSLRGRGLQLRHASKYASGDVLLMLHADCWLDPEAASQISNSLQDGSIDAGAFRQHIDAQGMMYRALEWGNAFRARWLRTPYGDQGIFVRRELLNEVGGVPDLPLMEDVELARRLRRHTKFALLPGPLHVSARRWRRRGVARQTVKNWMVLGAYVSGVSAKRLAKWYQPESIESGEVQDHLGVGQQP